MADHEVTVKLTADVDDYIKAMKRARRATRWSSDSRFGYWTVGYLVGVAAGIGASLFIGLVH
jgi:hypothetical protein